MELLCQNVVVSIVLNRNERKKIVLVDDNVLCGEALKLLFNVESGFQIIEGISSLDKLKRSKQIYKANLVLINSGLPFEIIVPVSNFLKNSFPAIPVVLVNVRKADQLTIQCIINGIMGIVWLSDSTEQLLYVCNKVLDGERYFGLSESELETYVNNLKNNNKPLDKITGRETTVLKLFAQGDSYKQIAEKLEISPRTVESHKNNILSKLGLGSLKELISYAIKNNVV